MNIPHDKIVSIFYTNWRGETAWRTVLPLEIWFGSTKYHPEPQWLLKARDIKKDVERNFTLQDIIQWKSLQETA